MSDTVVTEQKLSLWKGIAIGAFVLGGVCANVLVKLTTHDSAIDKLTAIVTRLESVAASHEERIKAFESVQRVNK